MKYLRIGALGVVAKYAFLAIWLLGDGWTSGGMSSRDAFASPRGPAVPLLSPSSPVSLSASLLHFSCAIGGKNPPIQTVKAKVAGSSNSVYDWKISCSQPWISVSPNSGTNRGGDEVTLTVAVNASYQPEAWTPVTTLNAPLPRVVHSAAWTGSRMVIWGGSLDLEPVETDTGGLYDPATDTWIGPTSVAGDPGPRHNHTAVWTGSTMVVWGGWNNVYFDSGGKYVPDQWTGATSQVNAASPREAHSAVWTGSRMIVWGGWDGGQHLNSGARYDPAADLWGSATSTAGAPETRQEHAAAWDGHRMFIWGGRDSFDINAGLNTGGLYDPASDTWLGATSLVNAPSARASVKAVWTGREVLVWGGRDETGPLNTGARYDPTHNKWLGPIKTQGAPTARSRHSAVWTGRELIVWGGADASGVVNSGAKYAPAIPEQGDHTESISVSISSSPSAAPVSPTGLVVSLSVSP